MRHIACWYQPAAGWSGLSGWFGLSD